MLGFIFCLLSVSLVYVPVCRGCTHFFQSLMNNYLIKENKKQPTAPLFLLLSFTICCYLMEIEFTKIKHHFAYIHLFNDKSCSGHAFLLSS
jgi:hypothetical protein